MDRFLEHLRQPVADYDCVAFPEHEIRALRERISIDTELEVQ